VLQSFISQVNQRPDVSTVDTVRKTFRQSFVREGTQKTSKKNQGPPKENLLSKGNDWKLLVDYEHKKVVFPPHIYSTSERPDVVIWSRMSRSVVLLELTCCAEEGVKSTQMVGMLNSSPLKLVRVVSLGIAPSGLFLSWVSLHRKPRPCAELSQLLLHGALTQSVLHKTARCGLTIRT